MQVRTQTNKIALCAFTISALTLPALAGTAGVLDRVPADAPVVFGISNVDDFLTDATEINTLLGDEGKAEVTIVAMMLRGMDGLDLNGSAALVVYPDMNEDDIDDERMFAIIPVTNFDEFSMGREADNGVVPYPLPENGMAYIRDIGNGYALFGEFPEMLRELDTPQGQMKANKALIGASGQSIAENSDLFMYVNFAQLGDAIDEVKNEMQEQGEMVGMMGGQQAQAGFDQFLTIFETIVNDGQSFIAGMSFDATKGVAFDAGVQFKEGSKTASYFNNANADASKYLNNIPNDDYFFAAAYDTSGKGIKKLFADYMQLAQELSPTEFSDFMNFSSIIEHSRGGAQIMPASNPMGMTGLFSTIVSYIDTDDSKSLIDSLGAMYTQLDGQGMDGLSMSSSFDAQGTEIAGSTAHAYNTSFSIDQAMSSTGFGGPSPQMVMQILFGPNLGPSGYIGASNNGVVQTLSTDQAVYARAVEAANGKNVLGAEAAIQRSAANLQKNTIFEMYFGADHTLNTAGPMMMMFGVIPEFEPLESHAPVALGVSADGGGATVRFWVPMEVIGSVMELIPEDTASNGNWDDDDYEDDEDEGMDF